MMSSSACVLDHVRCETRQETCPAPLTGLSLVWLNSATGTLEKPARKSKLLTPVTLRVCRPLQLTLGMKSFVSFSLNRNMYVFEMQIPLVSKHQAWETSS